MVFGVSSSRRYAALILNATHISIIYVSLWCRTETLTETLSNILSLQYLKQYFTFLQTHLENNVV